MYKLIAANKVTEFVLSQKMLSRIFGFLAIWFTLSGGYAQTIELKERVFVALAGENVTINVRIKQQANETERIFVCFDPEKNRIHMNNLLHTPVIKDTPQSIQLKNLDSSKSGTYRCKYNNARASWCLLVRDQGFKDRFNQSGYVGLITVGVITFLLLIFSVAGSLYVFKGRGVNATLRDGSSNESERDRARDRTVEELEEEHTNAIAADSPSLYASLEARPRSIYDVLDHSRPIPENSRGKAQDESKENERSMERTSNIQDNGVFESVYENF